MTWETYLAEFHRDRAGITEAILRRSFAGGPEEDGPDSDGPDIGGPENGGPENGGPDIGGPENDRARFDSAADGGADQAGTDPYAWLAAELPDAGLVLDVACGSGPLAAEMGARRWIGVDRSASELAAAREAGVGPLLRADAAALPIRTGSIDAVACSMGLMIVAPLASVVAEIRRVLRPGGRLVATIPAGGALRGHGRVVMAGLVAALGRAPEFPAGSVLPRIPRLIAEHGFDLRADERRTFAHRLAGAADADRFLASLYLPRVPEVRYRLARRFLRARARRGATVPVPLRRIVAVRP